MTNNLPLRPGENLLPLPSPLLKEFAGLSGPIEAFGCCLEGVIEAGDLVWFDSRIQPRHGDLVVIQMHPDRQAQFDQKYASSSGKPRLGIKRIEQRDGDWFLSADDAPEGYPISDNILLGPVVFRLSRLHRAGTAGQVQRLAKRHNELAQEITAFVAKAKSPAQKLVARRQLEQLEKMRQKQTQIERDAIEGTTAPKLPGAHCNSLHFGPGTQLEATGTPGIEPGAATSVESVEDDSVSLTNGGGVVLSDSLSAMGFDHLLQITASFDVWITNTGGGTPEFYLAAINSGGTIQQSQSVFPTASASPGQRVTLQVEVPITIADEATTIFAQLNWTGAQPSGTAEVRNAAMRSEHIKR